jgi:HSP20 family protein
MNGRTRPGQDMTTLRDAVDRLFEDSLTRMTRAPGVGEARHFVPAADAWENENEVVIEMVLPGVDPDEIDITYEQDTLSVSGQFPPREEDRRWVLTERQRGRFQRRFTLQVPVSADSVEANYQNGLLTLRLPKSEEIKPRKIQVKAG